MNTLRALLFAFAFLALNYYQAEAVQCYTCTSYMAACADPINTAGLQYQIEPNCRTSCYVYVSGGVTYRGCSDGLGCFDPNTQTSGTVTCGGNTYNLCTGDLCNAGSGSGSATAAPTVASSTAAVVTTAADSTTVDPSQTTASGCPANFCQNLGMLTGSNPCSCTCLPPYSGNDCSIVNCVSEDATCSTGIDCTVAVNAAMCPITCLNPACYPTTIAGATTTDSTTTVAGATTTTDTTTTTTTQAAVTTTPLCADDPTCINIQPADCASSVFVRQTCKLSCGTCTRFGLCSDDASCSNAQPTDCASSFVVGLCPVLCNNCANVLTTTATTAEPTTTTTTTLAPTTTINCVDDPTCINIQAADCSASVFVRQTCQKSCGTCTPTSQCSDAASCSNALPSDCASSFVTSLCPVLCNNCANAQTTTVAGATTTTVAGATTTTVAGATTTTDTTTTTTTDTTTTTTDTTTTTTTGTTTCAPLACVYGNFNGATCQCDCVTGTSGTLCEILDCTFDSLTTQVCVDYNTQYNLCADPAQSIYCIKTCNLCASSTTPVTPTTVGGSTTSGSTTTTTTDSTTTVTTPCPQLACVNSGNFNGVTCQCDCITGTSGTLCEILDCTFDNLGTQNCVDYNTQYGLCADPAQSIYCINTCQLCAASTTPVTPTTQSQASTTTPPCGGLTCLNAGILVQGNPCTCDCSQITLADGVTPRYSGTQCETDATPCQDEPTCGVGRQIPPSGCGTAEADAYCPSMCKVNGC